MSQAATYTYSLFSRKEGGEHITKANCLKGIIHYIHACKIKNILEIVIGIGTIPFALIEAVKRGEITHDFKYSGTEANTFCLWAIKKNMPKHNTFITLFDSLFTVPEEKEYDLIIVDGSDASFSKAVLLLSKRGMILVEGGRRTQLEIIQKSAKGRKYLKSSDIALTMGHLGGYSVFFFDPTIFDYATHIKNKVTAFVIYRLILIRRKIPKI